MRSVNAIRTVGMDNLAEGFFGLLACSCMVSPHLAAFDTRWTDHRPVG
jgi:hypothetical protein